MEPILLGPGDGDTVSDDERATVTIKAGRDEVALTEFRYAAGEKGPSHHVHARHADCFYVLEGELVVELGGEHEPVHAAPGTYVQVPPNVVHTFRNDGPGDARFLNLHAPSEGFHDYLRAIRGPGSDEEKRAAADAFDQSEPPADGGRPASDALVLRPGEGREVALGAASILIRAGAGDEPGALAVLESTAPPGLPGPVLHRHNETTDSFWVLDGTLTLRLDGETVAAGPGTYALVPPGAAHTFANPGDSPVRVLNLMFPGGFERYFLEASEAMPADPAALARIAGRYDFEPAA